MYMSIDHALTFLYTVDIYIYIYFNSVYSYHAAAAKSFGHLPQIHLFPKPLRGNIMSIRAGLSPKKSLDLMRSFFSAAENFGNLVSEALIPGADLSKYTSILQQVSNAKEPIFACFFHARWIVLHQEILIREVGKFDLYNYKQRSNMCFPYSTVVTLLLSPR